MFDSHFSCIIIEHNFKFTEILVLREFLNKNSELNIIILKSLINTFTSYIEVMLNDWVSYWKYKLNINILTFVLEINYDELKYYVFYFLLTNYIA